MSSKLQIAKNVNPQYMTFLWSEIHKFREAQSWGNFAYAMKLAITLIGYLTDDLKEKFEKKADMITNTLNQITSGNVGGINEINDTFQKHIRKKKLLETYANKALNGFITELTSALEQKGYMEHHKNVPKGYGPTYKQPI